MSGSPGVGPALDDRVSTLPGHHGWGPTRAPAHPGPPAPHHGMNGTRYYLNAIPDTRPAKSDQQAQTAYIIIDAVDLCEKISGAN